MLVVIHTKKLGLFGGTEVQARNQVDSLGNDGGHDECVSSRGHDIGDLDVKDLPVVVDPAASGASVDTVQADNVVSGEEGVEEETDDATDSVFGPHVERVINSNQELNLGSKVAAYAGNDAKKDAGPGRDEPRGRSGSDKSRDSTGTPTDERPLLSKAVIEKTPGHGGEHGGQAGVPAGHGSTEVGTEGRTTVETQPTEPKEDSSQCDKGDVVGTEVEHHLLVTATEDPGVGEGGSSGSDFDGATAGIVEDTVLETPAVGVPGPAGERAVHKGGPAEGEDHAWYNATSLGGSTNNESCRDTAELHLKGKSPQSVLYSGKLDVAEHPQNSKSRESVHSHLVEGI